MQVSGSTRRCLSFDEILHNTPDQEYFLLDAVLHDIPETSTETLSDVEETYQSYKEELNLELKTTDRVWLEFHAGFCEQYGKFAKSILYRIVKASVDHPENSIASANAITILKVMGVSFAHLDLKSIKVPQADLSGAILDRADLSYADLTGVYLKGASLEQTKMQEATLKEIQLGLENPYIFVNSSNIFCYSDETNTFFIAPSKEFPHKGYILNLSPKSIKELNIKWETEEIESILDCKLYSFVCSDKIIAFDVKDRETLLYILDCNFNKNLITIKGPLFFDTSESLVNGCISFFNDFAVTIKEIENTKYVSKINFQRFNRRKNRYEKKVHSLKIPYKIGNNVSLNSFSTASKHSFFSLSATAHYGKNFCVIFNYETGEILCDIPLDTKCSGAIISNDMCKLALIQSSSLTIYTLSNRSASTLLATKDKGEPTILDISTSFDMREQMQLSSDNKYLFFINKNNSLGIVDLSDRKVYHFSTGFIVTRFYVQPSQDTIVVCGHDIIEIVSIKNLMENATKNIAFSIGDKENIQDVLFSSVISTIKEHRPTLYSIFLEYGDKLKYRSLKIRSYFIDSSNVIQPNRNGLATFDYKRGKERLGSYVYWAKFSSNGSYILVTKDLPKKDIAGQSFQKIKISLHRLDGTLFHKFLKIYFSFNMSSDDEYAIGLVVNKNSTSKNSEVHIWHLPSKKLLYIIENYPLFSFKSFAAISKKYIVLQHKKYIRVFSIQNKLTGALQEEDFSDVNCSYIYMRDSHKWLSLYDDHMLIFANDSIIDIYNLDSLLKDKELNFSAYGKIMQIAVSSRQKIMLVLTEKNNKSTITLWDIRRWDKLDSFTYWHIFNSVQFSTDGKTIIGWTNNQFYIWHIIQGKLCLTYRDSSLFEARGIDITGATVDDTLQSLISIQK